VDPAALIEVLKSTPASLRAGVRQLKAGRIAETAGGGWSALDVVRHVRAADAIVAPRVWHILIGERPRLPAFDERLWAGLMAAANVPIDAQLAAFAIQRAELTALLRTLTAEQWARQGVHETTGEQTVMQVCASIAEHEREHIEQLAEIVRLYRA
jgi:DinB family protein